MIRTNLIVTILMAVAAAAAAQYSVGGWDPEEVENAKETVSSFKETNSGLVKFFENAAGYVVFPTVGKGGIGIGGAHGKGVVFQGGDPIGRSSLTQVTIGFQWGGQAYSEIVFFEDERSLERFLKGKFELAAQASAVAVTVGASADLAYENGVAVVTMVKGGLMYEASVGGQKFSFTPFEVEKDADKDE